MSGGEKERREIGAQGKHRQTTRPICHLFSHSASQTTYMPVPVMQKAERQYNIREHNNEEYLHQILKNSSIDEIVQNARLNINSYYRSNKEFELDNKSLRSKLLLPSFNVQTAADSLVVFAVGDYVYRKFFEKFDKNIFLTNDITVIPNGENWKFIMRSLSNHKLRGGQKIYYSLKSSRVNINNKNYQLAYTEHCISRIHERVKRSVYNYASLGDVFSYLYENDYFENVTLNDGNVAFSIFDMCEEGFSQFHIVKEIYGDNDISEEKYYYRIGYLPVDFQGEFAVFKTLLCPGFSNTPEYALLEKSDLDQGWLKRANENERKENLHTYDLQLIKVLHSLGIPQIITLNKQVFRFR